VWTGNARSVAAGDAVGAAAVLVTGWQGLALSFNTASSLYSSSNITDTFFPPIMLPYLAI